MHREDNEHVVYNFSYLLVKMRPPVFSTPPASHVISRKFEATPAATDKHDWRNLTTDTSIQIMSLESSAYHEENSIYDVTNHLSFVETIISPKADDIFPVSQLAGSQQIDGAETLVSMDALTHHYGNMLDARIIFTPKQCCLATPSSDMVPAQVPLRKYPITSRRERRLSRSFISDSNLDIQRRADHEYRNKTASVARSMSLNYTECTKRKNENCLVEPLLPCSYKSKIGGVKRIPSFRDTTTTVPGTSVYPKYGKTNFHLNSRFSKQTELIEDKHQNQQEQNVQTGEIPKSKIAKLVKCGLRSVIQSKNNNDEKTLDISESLKNSAALQRRRQRKVRYATTIGGLSEFLRKNERRKTIAVVNEEEYDIANVATSETSVETNDRDVVKECENERKISRPVMGNRRLHSMGMSNLKFNHCQRKLVFHSSQCSPKMNVEFDSKNYTEQYISSVNKVNSETRQRPKLGVLGSTKRIPTLPIDELDIDLVRDLKRRIERANKCTKIKTNGSLKVRPKLLAVNRPIVSSPRRNNVLRRQSQVPTAPSCGRQFQMKRESVV